MTSEVQNSEFLQEEQARQTVTFTAGAARRGARVMLPLALSVFAYGVVFGVLARHAGMSLPEAALMSSLVFAGASQFVALELWAAPLQVLHIVLATLIVNLRHLLMGAALGSWFSGLPKTTADGSMFFMTDENWAMTMRAYRDSERDAAVLLGGGLTLFAAWLSATVGGVAGGAAMPSPAEWGLDFAFIAVFTALAVGMWTGKRDLLPWGAAAVVALLSSWLLPGNWYILLGGIAVSIVGALNVAD